MSKWFLSDALMAAPARDVDYDAGIIRGAAIATVGEAKGHGVQLGQDFVNRVAELGNGQGKGGIKVRFGHPTMCGNALLDAPYIGRAKNFSVDGQIVRADIFLSNSASETPAGDLRARTLNLAAEDSDMFGTSIVFTPGSKYRLDADGNRFNEDEPEFMQLDGDPFVDIEKLHGADIVDEPAANAGLFSAISPGSFAVQATEFLDSNPKIWELIMQTPDVVAEFMTRYDAYSSRKKEDVSMDSQTTENEVVETEEVALSQEANGVDETATEAESVLVVFDVDMENEPAEFEELYDEYGSAFAEYAREEGFTPAQAKDAYIGFLRDELAEKDARIAALEVGEEEPAEFAAVSEDAEDNAAEHHAAELELKGVSRGVARFAASLNLDNE